MNIAAEYELIQVENQIVVNIFKVEGKVIAKYIYDFSNPENDRTEGTFVDYALAQGIEWEVEKQKEFHEAKREEAKFFLDLKSK